MCIAFDTCHPYSTIAGGEMTNQLCNFGNFVCHLVHVTNSDARIRLCVIWFSITSTKLGVKGQCPHIYTVKMSIDWQTGQLYNVTLVILYCIYADKPLTSLAVHLFTWYITAHIDCYQIKWTYPSKQSKTFGYFKEM